MRTHIRAGNIREDTQTEKGDLREGEVTRRLMKKIENIESDTGKVKNKKNMTSKRERDQTMNVCVCLES